MTTTSRPNGTVVPARFPGLCRNCRNSYQRGDLIRKAADKVWIYDACPNGEPQPAVESSSNGYTTPRAFEEMDLIRGIVRDELADATLKVDEAEVRAMIDADVTRIVEQTRDELLAQGVVKQQIEVKLPGGDVRAIEGKAHAALPRCIRLAAARRHTLLVGPAGSGKTHLASQVAEALGLAFAHISCSAGMSEGQLTGRLLPIGEGGRFECVRSEFVRCYEEGGVFLFDEIDAADSNTLLVLNSALANGQMALANRPDEPIATKHADFVCIAAANTFGTGADRQYVGRSQLDESTLDRFRIGQVEMDYDAEVEKALCPDDELRTRLQGYREAIRVNRLRRIVSTRFLRDAFVMKLAGDTVAEIDAALFAGWSPDEVRKVKGA
jgi:MoxR-like ATPase